MKNILLRPAKTEQKGKEAWNAIVSDSFYLWLFMIGLGGWLAAVCGLELALTAVILLTIPIAVLAMILLYGDKKIKFIGMAVWCIVLVLAAAVFFQQLVEGKNILLNQAVNILGKQYPYFWPSYPVSVPEEQQIIYATGAYIWLLGLIALLGAYLILAGNRILTALLLVISFAAQAASDIYAPYYWNLIWAGVLLALWFRTHGKKLPGNRTRFAGPQQILLVAAVASLLVLVIYFIKAPKDYKKYELSASAKEDILTAIDEQRYLTGVELLPDGQFENLGSFSPKGSKMLAVTMSKPESYYLRGFTGNIYTGDGWKETDSEKRWENRNLFYWLHEDGYYGQEALALAAQALGEEKAEEKNRIEIENIGASSKYCYVPYELLDSENELLGLSDQKIGDEGLVTLRSEGSRSYVYQALSNQIVNYPALAARLLDEEHLTEEERTYQKLENHYNEFVYDTYLDIPKELQGTLVNLLGDAEIESGDRHISYTDARQNILYILTSEYTYSEELEENWQGVDFIQEFLNNTKTGYSVHYASAAVMMFRYYGIPARYVEGYLITPEDVDAMTAGEAYIVDDAHSHAWVEFYQDGVGWLPFEVTPSYLNVMKQADEYQDISGVVGELKEDEPEEEQQQEEEETEGEEATEIDWLQVLQVILLILIALLLMILLAFMIWIFTKRYQSKKAKRLFDSSDMNVAIPALFTYSMNILAVSGLRIRNTSLYRYEKQISRMFDEETGKEFREIVDIRQETIYSTHTMTLEHKLKLMHFKNKIWTRIYKNGSWIQKLQLKYIYFL